MKVCDIRGAALSVGEAKKKFESDYNICLLEPENTLRKKCKTTDF